MINLAENKNPFYPSPIIKKKMSEAINRVSEYPDCHNVKVNSCIAKFFNLNYENVVVTNGSMEGMNLLCDVLNNDRTTIYSPTFWGYSDIFKRQKLNYSEVKLRNNMLYDVSQIDRDAQNSTLIFLCNPNNPTLASIKKEDIQTLIERNSQCNFVVDETMLLFDCDYNKKTVNQLIKEYDNLSVICSFSKIFGMAGIRAGAVLSNEKVIKEVVNRQVPYSIDIIKQEILPVALDDREYLQMSRLAITQNRKILAEKLRNFGALDVIEGETDFILVGINNGLTGSEVVEYLQQKGIMIRNMKTSYPQIEGEYLRISVGKKEENEELLFELGTLFSRKKEKNINIER